MVRHGVSLARSGSRPSASEPPPLLPLRDLWPSLDPRSWLGRRRPRGSAKRAPPARLLHSLSTSLPPSASRRASPHRLLPACRRGPLSAGALSEGYRRVERHVERHRGRHRTRHGGLRRGRHPQRGPAWSHVCEPCRESCCCCSRVSSSDRSSVAATISATSS